MATRPYILVVDDDPSILEATVELLQQEGYDVAPASNGLVALELLQERRPDLVVLDLMMPVMDGWTFVAKLRENPAMVGVPVLVLSAVRALAENASEIGAADYVGKPFNIDELLEKVERLASRRASPS